ncbi:hypothetical protein N7522_000814 [Penicillium canescens]|nr:hypothetical protein N7522_000814 [Penicillium canescens]
MLAAQNAKLGSQDMKFEMQNAEVDSIHGGRIRQDIIRISEEKSLNVAARWEEAFLVHYNIPDATCADKLGRLLDTPDEIVNFINERADISVPLFRWQSFSPQRNMLLEAHDRFIGARIVDPTIELDLDSVDHVRNLVTIFTKKE